jgi:hypothetical protein
VYAIKGATERLLKHQKRQLLKLKREARTLSNQVPLIDQNDIVGMLRIPIYIRKKRITLILNQIEPEMLEISSSRGSSM